MTKHPKIILKKTFGEISRPLPSARPFLKISILFSNTYVRTGAPKSPVRKPLSRPLLPSAEANRRRKARADTCGHVRTGEKNAPVRTNPHD